MKEEPRVLTLEELETMRPEDFGPARVLVNGKQVYPPLPDGAEPMAAPEGASRIRGQRWPGEDKK